MALIPGQMFGDMTGKLGGMVFSRNKAGKIVRSYVKPTDAKSDAQVTHRSSFSQAISRWNIISSVFKGQWNTFATNLFSPKKSKANGSYSGYQAFCSLNNILQSCSAHDYFAISTDTAVDLDSINWPANILEPPTAAFSSVIQTVDGDPLELLFSAFSFDTTTRMCVAKFDLTLLAPQLPPTFENPISNTPVGFAFYGSQIIPSGQNSCGNYSFYNLGSVKPPGTITGWTSLTELELEWEVSEAYMISLKQGIGAGVDMFVTCYAVGLTGQTSRMGMIRVTTT